MKLLVVGGTRFFGRFFVETARDTGHEVTVFHRGTTSAPPGVAEVIGERSGSLDALPHEVDAVLDTCAYRASEVRHLAGALQTRGVRRYVLVSSISVYPLDSGARYDESSPTLVANASDGEVNGETYGPMKVACEQAARDAFADEALIVRPGLIVGPRDTTNRFGYWPRRFADPEPIVAPGDGAQPVRFIDARDLSQFTLHALLTGVTGTFNAQGPDEDLRFRALLRAMPNADTRDVVWVDDETLLAHGVTPWTELPLWEPGGSALAGISNARAREAGLRFRPLHETIAASAAWEAERGEVDAPTLSREKERAILAAIGRTSGSPR